MEILTIEKPEDIERFKKFNSYKIEGDLIVNCKLNIRKNLLKCFSVLKKSI